MHNIIISDTIFAQATPQGRSALAIIRISGSNAWEILSKLALKKINWKPATLHLIDLPNLDQVTAVGFKAPKSFTGEDAIEIFFHGSPLISDKIQKQLIKFGVRPAEPGEFTFRAVLNGKISLSDAEILNAKIHANSEIQLSLLDTPTKSIELFKDLLQKAYDVLAELESDIEFQEGNGISSLNELENKMKYLMAQVKLNKKLSTLPSVLLYGPTNCGKSTLFNAILGYERSIVSSIPGTTRDYIETEYTLNGISFKIIDSAGIRSSSEDKIEHQGMKITDKLYESADLIIDFSKEYDKSDLRVIPIVSKSDLISQKQQNIFYVSGKTGEGVSELLQLIVSKLKKSVQKQQWNMWISEFAVNTLEELAFEFENMQNSQLPEIQSLHLNNFCNILRSRLEMEPENLYKRIFSRFCIGK